MHWLAGILQLPWMGAGSAVGVSENTETLCPWLVASACTVVTG